MNERESSKPPKSFAIQITIASTQHRKLKFNDKPNCQMKVPNAAWKRSSLWPLFSQFFAWLIIVIDDIGKLTHTDSATRHNRLNNKRDIIKSKMNQWWKVKRQHYLMLRNSQWDELPEKLNAPRFTRIEAIGRSFTFREWTVTIQRL